MLRKFSIAVAASLLSTAALAQAPMQDTWDTNAPNGDRIVLVGLLVPLSHSDRTAHGHTASAAEADRAVEVRPGTRYVNVTAGETVLFKVGDQSFTWTFDPTFDHRAFDLAEIAPGDIAVQGVRVYCAPDLYEFAA